MYQYATLAPVVKREDRRLPTWGQRVHQKLVNAYSPLMVNQDFNFRHLQVHFDAVCNYMFKVENAGETELGDWTLD